MSSNSTNLDSWLALQLETTAYRRAPLCQDASARMYERIFLSDRSLILMIDQDSKSLNQFVSRAQLCRQAGLAVPEIYARTNAYLLLEDLGSQHFEDLLTLESSDALYQQAFKFLRQMQAMEPPSDLQTSRFDATSFAAFIELFEVWYLKAHCDYSVSTHEQPAYQRALDHLCTAVLSQPQAMCHWDFHCRNLMWRGDRLGVIDFQDMQQAPVSFDLMSLIKDAYVAWPRAQVLAWMKVYFDDYLAPEHRAQFASLEAFIKACDWMGLVRHLRVLGVFARLHRRDGRASYLQYIPRVKAYVFGCLNLYPELSGLIPVLRREPSQCAP